MNKVFIYETLKRRSVLEEALGENHGKVLTPAITYGYMEMTVSYNHDLWPTLWSASENHVVKGDVINVTDTELEKLRAWENNYRLKLVPTDHGDAWAFVFDSVSRAPMADVIRWRGR